MEKPGIPAADHAVALLKQHFFARTDKVCFLAPWGKPCPGEGNENLNALLLAHLLGKKAPPAPFCYRTKRSQGAKSGHWRIGSYTPAHPGETPWLCIDFDGPGHATPLLDPEGTARKTHEAFCAQNLPSYLEKSGGGTGWHLWCFFSEPLPAADIIALAKILVPKDAPLAEAGVAVPEKGIGIEIFPKRRNIKEGKFGNSVWLPWWSGAPEGANVFYRFDDEGIPEPYIPDCFEVIQPEGLENALAARRKEIRKKNRERKDQETKELLKAKVDPDWAEWRKIALDSLPLEAVYGDLLTGKASGEGWLECRDPNSPSGDRAPSAGVATGTGEAERGVFHSFISGETYSVFDFLIAQGRAMDFKRALRFVADFSGVPLPVLDSNPPSREWGKTAYKRPEIYGNYRQLRDILSDAWNALRKANSSVACAGQQTPFIFTQGGRLVRIEELEKPPDPEPKTDPAPTDVPKRKGRRKKPKPIGPRISAISEAALIGLLTHVADWFKYTKDAVVSAPPPTTAARVMLALPHSDIPQLNSVVTVPVFGSDGRLLTKPGYHPEDRLWFHQFPGEEFPEIPEDPSRDDIRRAVSLIYDDLLIDFPFVAQSDRVHMAAALILPFVRRMISGCTPIHLIEAPSVGSGKGLLSNLISVVATGMVADAHPIPLQDEEARKMITAELSTGRPLILLDNADEKKTLSSPPLASVITAESWTDRILGKTEMTTIPNQAMWVLTGNNPRLSLEIARRCLRIRINPQTDRPWLRTDFKHPKIVEWAKSNRKDLLRSVLVLCQAWIAAGEPLHEKTLGSFEDWAGVIGGILDVAGIPGFLSNLEEMYEASDTDGQMWREFTAEWWDEFASQPKSVKDLNEFCDRQDLMISIRGDKTSRSQQIRLGRALLSARDRVFGPFLITRANPQSKHKGGSLYALVRKEGGGGAGSENGDVWGCDGDVDRPTSPFANQGQC